MTLPGIQTLPVFRQSNPGDWNSVLRQLREALNNLFLLDLEGPFV